MADYWGLLVLALHCLVTDAILKGDREEIFFSPTDSSTGSFSS
jgi:hypothetical protein